MYEKITGWDKNKAGIERLQEQRQEHGKYIHV